jgi:peptidoglycan/xylan/chitin deacetylase (PgdA/CDA1 family)
MSYLKKLMPPPRGIPVLTYHKVWPGITDALTITPEKLEEQWTYLKNVGYRPLLLSEFADIVAGKVEYIPNSFLITFDDGYKNNLTYVYPLLQKLGWCATLFIIAGTLDGTFSSKENIPMHELMDVDDLKQLDHRTIQIAMHGYHHENFCNYPVKELNALLTHSIKLFDDNKFLYDKVLAYPYGCDPQTRNQSSRLHLCLAKHKIKFAFKTGNMVCRLPIKDIYKIPRIDVRGTDSIDDILLKITYGSI